MEKRHYERPKSKVINLRTESYLLAGTNGGEVDPDNPGGKIGSAKRQSYIWEEEYENQ